MEDNEQPNEAQIQTAPSVDSLVSDAVSDDMHAGGNTALDDLVISITDTTTNVPPRAKRGRPAGSSRPSVKSPKHSKAELQQLYQSALSDLAAERARSNESAVKELAEQLEMATFMLFGAIASVRGEHWAMRDKEGKDIGKTGALALAPHADALRKYSPWVMFSAALGSAFYSRIKEDQRLIALHGVATNANTSG